MKQELRVELINSFLQFFTIFLGVFALYLHNSILPWIYLGIIIVIFIADLYFCCTRCEKYGKFCHALGGLLASKLFRQRENKPMKFDDEFYMLSILFLILFPLPFLLYYQDWLLITIYVISATLMFWYRRKTICKKCKSEWCCLKN